MQISCRFRDVGLCSAWAYSFGLVVLDYVISQSDNFSSYQV